MFDDALRRPQKESKKQLNDVYVICMRNTFPLIIKCTLIQTTIFFRYIVN